MSQVGINAKSYRIEPEGQGFYAVHDPFGSVIGTCEGAGTAVDIAEDHLRKVYGWYERTSNLSPMQARAAKHLTHDQAVAIIEQFEDVSA